jgi:hypothetical protein
MARLNCQVLKKSVGHTSAGSIDLEDLTIGRLPQDYITTATTKCRAREDMILSGNPINDGAG